MKVNLFDGYKSLEINEKKKNIMMKISKEILDSLSIVYDTNDIESINFYIKGVEKIVALVIRIPLKFIESDDVINVIKNRMSKIETVSDDPGLSFMLISKSFSFLSGSEEPNSEISFWYQFTNEEILEWNGSHIYSFDML